MGKVMTLPCQLHPDEFERLKRYAFQLLTELSENTHLETV